MKGAVRQAALRPLVWAIHHRVRESQLFIKACADAGRCWGIDKPVLHLWRAREHAVGSGGARDKFLNSRIMQVNVQMRIHRHADGGHITGAMPGETYAESLTQVRQLQRGCDTADLLDVAANKVDAAIHDKIVPFSWVIE